MERTLTADLRVDVDVECPRPFEIDVPGQVDCVARHGSDSIRVTVVRDEDGVAWVRESGAIVVPDVEDAVAYEAGYDATARAKATCQPRLLATGGVAQLTCAVTFGSADPMTAYVAASASPRVPNDIRLHAAPGSTHQRRWQTVPYDELPEAVRRHAARPDELSYCEVRTPVPGYVRTCTVRGEDTTMIVGTVRDDGITVDWRPADGAQQGRWWTYRAARDAAKQATERGHHGEARDYIEQALGLAEELAPSSTNHIWLRHDLADAFMREGLVSRAEAEYRAALDGFTAMANADAARAHLHFDLARAIWYGGGNKREALRHARTARSLYAGTQRDDDVARVARWLHAPPEAWRPN